MVNEVVYPHPCILLGLHVAHLGAQADWIQVFDVASTPADGAVPIITHAVAKDSDAAIEGMLANHHFTYGVYVCESSTVSTKTLSVTSDIFVTMMIETPSHNPADTLTP
jgi:hypothetical protein